MKKSVGWTKWYICRLSLPPGFQLWLWPGEFEGCSLHGGWFPTISWLSSRRNVHGHMWLLMIVVTFPYFSFLNLCMVYLSRVHCLNFIFGIIIYRHETLPFIWMHIYLGRLLISSLLMFPPPPAVLPGRSCCCLVHHTIGCKMNFIPQGMLKVATWLSCVLLATLNRY